LITAGWVLCRDCQKRNLKSEVEIRKMYSQALGRMEDLRQQFQGPNTVNYHRLKPVACN
jgi:superfamily II helicase